MQVSSKGFLIALTLSSAALFTSCVDAGNVYFRCDPKEVLETKGRVQVLCSNSIVLATPITYPVIITRVAIDIDKTSDSKIKRFEDLAATALSFGLEFVVRITEDGGDEPPGCNPANCRAANRFGIRRP